MGLFSRKSKSFYELSFNKKDLQEKIARLSDSIYELRSSDGLALIKNIMELEKNIAIITTHAARTEIDLASQRARIAAFDDILNHIERSIADGKRQSEIKNKKANKGSISQRKRKSVPQAQLVS